MSAALARSVSSLRIPNYRRYFAGQVVSLSGNWMQIVAETWLILTLTGSGVAVGIVSGLQFLPMLLFGAWGGSIADRFDKRKLLLVTQALLAIPALLMWGATAGGVITPAMVYGLVLLRGFVTAIDNPTRQSFVIEMVGHGQLVNAVSLNSVIVHSARIVGPALAGGLIATVGVEPCFLVNASSFAVMIWALATMNRSELLSERTRGKRRGGVREALRYVASTPALAIPLGMMALVGTLGFNFPTLVPLLARFSFGGDATTYTLLFASLAAGSVVGALATGARGRTSSGLLVASAAAFGVFALLAAAAPTIALEALALAPMGAASVTFAAGVNSTLQLDADPAMRGRVMALYSVVFIGSTPIGGPITGLLAETLGPRSGLVMTAAAAFVAAIVARWAFRRAREAAASRPEAGRGRALASGSA
ncbi:MFS transporter [Thermoleophilia bacterium SCSIO 60948]|nr:MFS transporter [Thermoleophilia bacterium SCSIO 60948]